MLKETEVMRQAGGAILVATTLFIGGVGLGACTTLVSETRISRPLSASQYNSVASRYMEQPTFVSVQTMSDKAEVLKVQMDQYGAGYDANLDIITEYVAFFDKRYVAAYLPLIDKFLEWEALANTRGDLLEREIGKASTWGNGLPVELRFSFYSGNASNHFLTIERCAAGTCADKALTLTRANAIILKELLEDFGEGKVGHSITDGVYR